MSIGRSQVFNHIKQNPGVTLTELKSALPEVKVSNFLSHLVKTKKLTRRKVPSKQFPNMGVWSYYVAAGIEHP